MEKSSKRGKIPQSDWPLIMSRYEAGETLSSIARTYDCSPPAISYVVSRSRARGPVASPAAVSAEPQLIKSPPVNGAAATGSAVSASAGATTLAAEPPANGTAVQPKSASEIFADPRGDIWPRQANGLAANGSAATAPLIRQPPVTSPVPHPGPANGDHRPKLHLSLGNGSQPESAAPQTGSQVAERQHPTSYQPQHGHDNRPAPVAAPSLQPGASGSDQIRPAAVAALFEPSHRVAPPRHDGNGGGPTKGANGSYIDHELRARVDGDIAAFLAAFDAALMQDTQESRSALREATDRLLRAGARTRIELERLEARMPLPRRDATHMEPVWRSRQ
jgi:hypothetical protein